VPGLQQTDRQPMVRAPEALWNKPWATVLAAVLVVLLLQRLTDGFGALERRLYDFGVRMASHAPAADIAIVTIGEPQSPESAAALLQQSEPLAELVDRLTQAGAALIVLAVPLSESRQLLASTASPPLSQTPTGDADGGNAAAPAEPRIQSVRARDALLVRGSSLQAGERVVIANVAPAVATEPLSSAVHRSAEGAIETDSDGVLRSQALFAGPPGQRAPVAALLAAAHRLKVPNSEVRRVADAGVHLGRVAFATEIGDRVRPHFYASRGAQSPFAHETVSRLSGDRIVASRYAGKTVFVEAAGAARMATAAGIALTPAEVLAHTSAALSLGHFVVTPPWAAHAALFASAAIATLLMWRWPRLGNSARIARAVGLTVVLFALQWTLQTRAGLWVPLLLPAALLWCGIAFLALWSAWRRLAAPGLRGHSRAAADRRQHQEPAQPTSGDAPTLRSAAGRRTVGRFLLEKEIGRGSMGAVYLARDVKANRLVAVKMLALGGEFDVEARDEARRRFLREAQTTRRLQHRDIVAVYDAGETRELAWLAMEYLRGQDLSHYTRPGKLLPVAEVVHIAARVAAALAYAHRQGVVHRDIKPANVVVDLSSNDVKVTDFGIAHIADASRTRTGLVLGTPAFMAPEQLAGSPADGRSDLYSLGVMLFQLLSGHLPHEAESISVLMGQIANDVAADIRTWRPELPETLANIVALALVKRPEMRYADGDQLAQDLRAVESTLTLSGKDPPAFGAGAHGARAFADTSPPGTADPRHNSEL
jgi:CHASE2 domain-containing sensor protein/predicted Ser/Thr protein kinase